MGVIATSAHTVRGRRWAATSVGAAVVLTRLAQAYGVALLVAGALTGAELTSTLSGLWIAAAMVVSRAALLRMGESIAESMGQRVTVSVRRQLLEHLVALGPSYMSNRRTGDVTATLVDGTEALETLIARVKPAKLLSWLGPLLAAVAVGVVDGVSGALLVVALVVLLGTGPLWNTIGKKQHDRVFVDLAAMDAGFVDAVQGLATAKALGASGRLRDRLASQAELIQVGTMRILNTLFTHALVTRWATAGAIAVVVVRVGYLAVDGAVSPVAAITAMLVTLVAFIPVDEAGKYLHATMTVPMTAAKIDEFLAEKPTISTPTSAGDSGWAARPDVVDVRLENVSYRYPDRPEDAVHDVSLSLRPGRTTALVGPSGSGKSTVVSLLLRLIEPTSGQVTSGGVDLREIPPNSWWQRVAVVSQDTHLFPGTLRENIALAKPDANQSEIERAATAAGLAADIAAMPAGYDTRVSERGGRLSGGQRQRVAIARALVANAPILILDEATASLDGRTETAVHQAIQRASQGRAVLIVAHRMATVRGANEIVVLEHGRVVERGNHDDLLESAGIYHRLVEAGATP